MRINAMMSSYDAEEYQLLESQLIAANAEIRQCRNDLTLVLDRLDTIEKVVDSARRENRWTGRVFLCVLGFIAAIATGLSYGSQTGFSWNLDSEFIKWLMLAFGVGAGASGVIAVKESK